MDEYVVMRMAQLVENGKVAATIARALGHGNVGGKALAARAEALVHAIKGL
jgi:hypothetical protein